MMMAQAQIIVTPSSVASMTMDRYPNDDIQVDTPCKLVVPYGRNLNKFHEVAIIALLQNSQSLPGQNGHHCRVTLGQ
jgi:hypothetical protein